MKRNNHYMVNGYKLSHYRSVNREVYLVYRDGKSLGLCWSIDALAKLIETDAETIKAEMQKQRYLDED